MLRSIVIAFLASATSLIDVPSESAPITLAFEAEIVRVFDTVPFEAGVSFKIGDKVTGRFTYEPDEVGGGSGPFTAFESQQTTRAFVNVDGVEFSTPDETTGIKIRSFNNSSSTLFGENDRIDIGSQLVSGDPSNTPNVTGAGLAIFLQSTAEVLPGAIIPAEPEIWNQLINFDSRLRLTLRNNDGGSVGFTANLVPGSFVEVPEPAAVFSILTAAILSLLGGRCTLRGKGI